MSAENVKKFYEALSRDSDLQQKCRELSQKHQGESLDEAKLARMAEQDWLPLAAERGFSFTWDELFEYGRELQQDKNNGELSDEELLAVSAGLACSGLGQNVTDDDGFCFVLGFNKTGEWCIWFGTN